MVISYSHHFPQNAISKEIRGCAVCRQRKRVGDKRLYFLPNSKEKVKRTLCSPENHKDNDEKRLKFMLNWINQLRE